MRKFVKLSIIPTSLIFIVLMLIFASNTFKSVDNQIIVEDTIKSSSQDSLVIDVTDQYIKL